MKKRISVYLSMATFCATSFLMTIPLFAGTVSALATTGTAQIPCYEAIVAGGELHVPIDADRKADLEITTRGGGLSVFTVLEYRNGKPRKGFQPESTTLDRDEYRKAWRFNRFFDQTPESSVVDEVRIKVEKGAVTARMGQTGDNRQDFYNYGGQYGTFVYPKKPLTVKITGDDPSNGQTSGRFWLKYETGNYSKKKPFTIEGGKTLTWNYPAGQGITDLEVDISKGRAKISKIQGPDSQKAATKQSTVKKAPKQKYTPKAKAVTQFTVAEPYGTSKPLTPGKNLAITVTGLSGTAKGKVELFSDAQKTQKIDQFGFTLKKNQAKSHFVSGKNQMVWARVWVSKGSFKVKLDQSPNARAVPPPKKKKAAAAAIPKIKKEPATVTAKAQPTASSVLIFKGEVPLYKGARVLKSKAYGAHASASLEVAATLQDIADFYKQAMSAKGWTPIMAMVQGDRGAIMFKKKNRQLAFKLREKGDTSKIDIAMMGQ